MLEFVIKVCYHTISILGDIRAKMQHNASRNESFLSRNISTRAALVLISINQKNSFLSAQCCIYALIIAKYADFCYKHTLRVRLPWTSSPKRVILDDNYMVVSPNMDDESRIHQPFWMKKYPNSIHFLYMKIRFFAYFNNFDSIFL